MTVTVVLYGVGSPVVVDVEDSLARAGVTVRAGIRNVPGSTWLRQAGCVIERANLEENLKASPFLVPLFAPGNRQAAAREAEAAGFTQPYTLTDPTSIVPLGWIPGPGTYVNAGCTLGAETTTAEFVFINRGACVGHHVRLGRFASIGPGAVLGGQVQVGMGGFVGAGAVVLPEIRIGANAVVAAGAVVTRDVPDHALVVGNPAQVRKTDIPGYKDMAVD